MIQCFPFDVVALVIWAFFLGRITRRDNIDQRRVRVFREREYSSCYYYILLLLLFIIKLVLFIEYSRGIVILMSTNKISRDGKEIMVYISWALRRNEFFCP